MTTSRTSGRTNRAVLNSLTEAEWLLVQETEPAALASLDEDDLLLLHDRVRRARKKYLGQYRRGASSSVAERGGRGASFRTNQRARDKAEVFETALARVSREVGRAANRTAAELRQERLAAARAEKGAGPPVAGSAAASTPDRASTRRRTTKTTGGIKKDAHTRAAGTRRQAARDTRRSG